MNILLAVTTLFPTLSCLHLDTGQASIVELTRESLSVLIKGAFSSGKSFAQLAILMSTFDFGIRMEYEQNCKRWTKMDYYKVTEFLKLHPKYGPHLLSPKCYNRLRIIDDDLPIASLIDQGQPGPLQSYDFFSCGNYRTSVPVFCDYLAKLLSNDVDGFASIMVRKLILNHAWILESLKDDLVDKCWIKYLSVELLNSYDGAILLNLPTELRSYYSCHIASVIFHRFLQINWSSSNQETHNTLGLIIGDLDSRVAELLSWSLDESNTTMPAVFGGDPPIDLIKLGILVSKGRVYDMAPCLLTAIVKAVQMAPIAHTLEILRLLTDEVFLPGTCQALLGDHLHQLLDINRRALGTTRVLRCLTQKERLEYLRRWFMVPMPALGFHNITSLMALVKSGEDPFIKLPTHVNGESVKNILSKDLASAIKRRRYLWVVDSEKKLIKPSPYSLLASSTEEGRMMQVFALVISLKLNFDDVQVDIDVSTLRSGTRLNQNMLFGIPSRLLLLSKAFQLVYGI